MCTRPHASQQSVRDRAHARRPHLIERAINEEHGTRREYGTGDAATQVRPAESRRRGVDVSELQSSRNWNVEAGFVGAACAAPTRDPVERAGEAARHARGEVSVRRGRQRDETADGLGGARHHAQRRVRPHASVRGRALPNGGVHAGVHSQMGACTQASRHLPSRDSLSCTQERKEKSLGLWCAKLGVL